MNILVTGGSGMVGAALKNILPNAVFLSSRDIDLRNEERFYHYLSLEKYNNQRKFDAIIHLAARVGGVKGNMNYMADFLTDNIKINTSVLNCAKEFQVPKVISILSTCVYPDKNIQYPLTEDQLHNGFPHESNYGYAFAKRMLDVQSRAYRKQYGCNFITVIPNNLYGENDLFDVENGHVIPSIISKVHEAKEKNLEEIECWGDGTSLREFTYSQDIAKILVFLLENYDGEFPINIGNTEEISIKEVVEHICQNFEYTGKIIWNTNKPSGQFKKPSSNQKLLNLGWNKESYIPLKLGLKNTCEWYKINSNVIRKK